LQEKCAIGQGLRQKRKGEGGNQERFTGTGIIQGCRGVKAVQECRLCFNRICYIGFIGLYVIYHVLRKNV
jgi:hypothetical protein